MSYTDLEYALVKFHQLHRYDAYANPDKVGLGRCGCGVDMYYCEHDPHFARALIAELGLTHEVRTLEDGMGGVSTNYKTGETTVHSKPCTHQVRVVGKWENTPWPSLRQIAERIAAGRRTS